MMRGVAEACTPTQAASLEPPLHFKAISVHPSFTGMTFPRRSSIPRLLAPLVVGRRGTRSPLPPRRAGG